MQLRFIFTFTVLLLVSFSLAACGSNLNSPNEGIETPALDGEEEAVPYPSPNEVYIPVTGSDPAYPAPETNLEINPYPDPNVVDPYPGTGGSEMEIDPEKTLAFDDLAPLADDKKLATGNVFVQSSQLLIDPQNAGQAELWMAGELPTPCHQLRVVVPEPESNGQIFIKAYTVVDPDMMCIQVLEPFQAMIPLHDLPTGSYSVSINGEHQWDFNLP